MFTGVAVVLPALCVVALFPFDHATVISVVAVVSVYSSRGCSLCCCV